MTTAPKDPVVEVTVAASPDLVWEALREPEQIRRWFGWEYEGLDGEIALIAQDVAATRQLADQGLTAQSRLRESQRQQSALKRDKLEVQSFLARARHNRIDIDQRIGALRTVREAENALALRALELAIARTDQKIASLAASIVAASDELEASGLRDLPAANFTLVRRTASGTEQVTVTEQDRLQPGDILAVDRHFDALLAPPAR